MSKSGKATAGAQTGSAPAADSSDDEDAPAAANRRAPRPKQTFSKDRVYEALCGDTVHSVQSHLPSYMSHDVRADWIQWRDNVPQALHEVPAHQRALPLLMPLKHTARVPQPTEHDERQQRELMTYRNPGGQAYSKAERHRDALASKRLRVSEVPVGTTVCLRRHDEDPWTPAGYGTPFYVGHVLEIEEEPTTTSSSDPEVKSLLVHYRVPVYKGKLCDDVSKPLRLACVGLHQWDPSCERRGTCINARPSGATTSRMTVRAPAETVFEAGATLLANEALSKQSKLNLLQTDKSWRSALGLKPEPVHGVGGVGDGDDASVNERKKSKSVGGKRKR